MQYARWRGMFALEAHSNPAKGLRFQGGEWVKSSPPLSFLRDGLGKASCKIAKPILQICKAMSRLPVLRPHVTLTPSAVTRH